MNDDYVISLLKKDADANQKRYPSTGLGSLFSKRSRSNAPKPNTRFLRNVIRDTESHNVALKAREEEESKARFRDLQQEQRNGKRWRDEGDEERDSSSKRRRHEARPDRWASVLGGRVKSTNEAGRSSAQHVTNDKREARDRKHHRPRSRTSTAEGHNRDVHNANNVKSRKVPSKQKQNDNGQPSQHRSTSPPTTTNRSNTTETLDTDANASDSDSTSLSPILGPLAPSPHHSRGRGRGKPHPSSSINDHFAPHYNPQTDIPLCPSLSSANDLNAANADDDWDLALEALRDRKKWQAQGAERLRAAGFTDEEIGSWRGRRWAQSAGGEREKEKDVEDVRWRKQGEAREWDRGKSC